VELKYKPMFVGLQLKYRSDLAVTARAQLSKIRDAFDFETARNVESSVVFERSRQSVVSCTVQGGAIDLLLARVDEWQSDLGKCLTLLECGDLSGTCECVDTFQLTPALPDLYDLQLLEWSDFTDPTALYCTMSSKHGKEELTVGGYLAEDKSFIGVKLESSFAFTNAANLTVRIKSFVKTASRVGTSALKRWLSSDTTGEGRA